MTLLHGISEDPFSKNLAAFDIYLRFPTGNPPFAMKEAGDLFGALVKK